MSRLEDFEIVVQAVPFDSSDLARTVVRVDELRKALESTFPDKEIIMAKGGRKQCIGFRFELKGAFENAAALQDFIVENLDRTAATLSAVKDPSQALHIHVGFSEGQGFRDDWGLDEGSFSRVI